MKTQKIIMAIGYVALFFGSLFNLVNSITEKEIFAKCVTIPLLLLAVVGIFCNIIIVSKNIKANKSSSKEKNHEKDNF